MSYIGKTPTSVPLTSSDITDGIISTAKIADDAISAAKLAAGVGGKVLQVVQTNYTTPTSMSFSAGTVTDITGVTVNITPSSTSSKILVMCRVMVECASVEIDNSMIGLKRGSTEVGGVSQTGSRNYGITVFNINYYAQENSRTPETSSFQYMDSPSSTSEQTYKATFRHEGSGTLYINRTITDDSASNSERGTSNITVMEIAS